MFIQCDESLTVTYQLFLENHKYFLNKIKEFQQRHKLIVCLIPFSNYTGSPALSDFLNKRSDLLFIPVNRVDSQKNIRVQVPDIKDLHDKYFLNQEKQSLFERRVEDIKNRMTQGDFYLINYTLPLSFPLRHKLITRELHPKHFHLLGANGCYLDIGDEQHILSFSPECFISTQNEIIKTYPIKGTLDSNQDKSLLQNSLKEKAETTMVVDLMRNDLGKICNYGSVTLNYWQKIIEQHKLWQMHSEIQGNLKQPWSIESLLQLLPAGSISGTPKHECLKYILKTEVAPRNYYTGLCGFIDQENSISHFNILIRSLIYDQNNTQIGVGAGITIDSNPHQEWLECKKKYNSILDAFDSLMSL